jgi:hypothetical protein
MNCDYCDKKLKRPYVKITRREILPVRRQLKALIMARNPLVIFRFCSQGEFIAAVGSGKFDELLKEEFQDL